jgi:hypothetical protein
MWGQGMGRNWYFPLRNRDYELHSQSVRKTPKPVEKKEQRLKEIKPVDHKVGRRGKRQEWCHSGNQTMTPKDRGKGGEAVTAQNK